MNLWIRSQDKKHLVKCEAIMYEETGTGYGLRVFAKNYDFNIARYKTKERALEVLDEIQNIFSLNIKNKHYDEADLFLKAKMLDSCYEMPKE